MNATQSTILAEISRTLEPFKAGAWKCNSTAGQASPLPARTLRRRAFTLIEILIVVIILGILASIVIPQFSNASHLARENTLRDVMRYLRTQVIVFKAQHRDVPAGYPGGNTASTPDAATFIAQMTQYTDENCNTSATPSDVFKYGPYLSQMPADPISSATGVWIVTSGMTMPAPDQTQPYGWIYNPQTQEIIANLEGQDENGVLYSTY